MPLFVLGYFFRGLFMEYTLTINNVLNTYMTISLPFITLLILNLQRDHFETTGSLIFVILCYVVSTFVFVGSTIVLFVQVNQNMTLTKPVKITYYILLSIYLLLLILLYIDPNKRFWRNLKS